MYSCPNPVPEIQFVALGDKGWAAARPGGGSPELREAYLRYRYRRAALGPRVEPHEVARRLLEEHPEIEAVGVVERVTVLDRTTARSRPVERRWAFQGRGAAFHEFGLDLGH